MASTLAASTALPTAGGSRPSMDRDFSPAGNRVEHGQGQIRESSRSSRRKPSASSSAVQYSLPSPSQASFELKPPSRPFAAASPISPSAGQSSFPAPIRGAHFLPPSSTPSPPFGRPVQQRTPSYGYHSYPQQHQQQQQQTPGSNGSLNLEVSPSPASRHTQRRESGSSPTPGRRMHTGGYSPGQISVPRQPPPPMLTSLPLPPTPARAPAAGGSRQRLPPIESLSAAGAEFTDSARFLVNDEVSWGGQNPPVPVPVEVNAAPAARLTPEKQQKSKPLLKKGPVPLLVVPGARRDVLSVHSQVAVLEGERSPNQTSPSRGLFEQQHQQPSAASEPVHPKRLVPALHHADNTLLPEQSQPVSISLSPQRPSYSRGNTAPLLSPPKPNSDRPQQQVNFHPPQRPRQASTGLVDRLMGSATSPEGRQGMLRSQTDSPSKWARHSEDMLRVSTSSPLGKKEMKALEKEQAKAAASGASLSPQKSVLGITPRKSSGGLKALFKKASGQGGKGKEKEKDSGWVEVPPVPAELRRPSQDQRAFENGRPSYSHDGRAMSATPPRGVQRMLPEMERQRSVSQSSLGTSPAPPSRQLPPLPPPTPSYSTSDTASPMSPNGELSSQLVTPSTSSTSLQERGDTSPETGSEASSSTTTGGTPLRPSASLHLLELPELDLSFNFAFDNVRGSPSRNQASPTRPSPKSPSRSNTSVAHTRNRPNAARRRSSSFDGLHSSHSQELWRSFQRSNSGSPISASRTLDLSTSNPKLILSSASHARAPVGADQASDESHASSLPAPPFGHEQNDSVSSEPSVPSTSDHLRTPSNSSWAAEKAPSISPPHTPKDERAVLVPALSASGGGIKISANLVVAPTPTPPTAPASSEKRVALGRPLSFGPPVLASEVGPSSPVCLVNSILAPAADIKTQPPRTGVKGASKPTIGPLRREKRLQSKSRRVVSAAIVSQIELASELEQLLFSFRYPSTANKTVDRAGIVRSQLLQMLHEGEKRGFDPSDQAGNAALRAVCFDWADALLFELRVEQPAIERGACLEGLAAILEAPCLSARAIDSSTQDSASFRGLMVRVIAFVMSKLGAKGVFHNSLLFSGRVLAFAFFRIPHVAQQLLVTLPTQRQALMRFSRAVLAESSVPVTVCPLSYPPHLRGVCFDDSKTYLARLHAHQPSFATPEEQAAFVFRPGNWLRRWQSDDSELFPAFYRSYHRQLAVHLSPAIEYFEARSQPIPAAILLRAPGYAHLASVFASKCHSYILGSVNAVTTSSSSPAFDATESAGFRGNAKPAVLETANRRLSETMLSFANSRLFVDQTFGGVVEVDGSQLWANMIECWIKYLISKTSLYAPKGVFCLFDLLDCVFDPPSDAMGASSLQITTLTVQESLLDVPHLISVIRIVLTEGEHALTLVKIIAFVFTHYETLCARAEDRKELCIDLLLDKQLFERLVLFWSQSVRSYILRLIVFRLGHLHTTAAEGDSHDVEIATVRLLNARLDRIRKRHEELEPATEEDEHPLADNLSLTDIRDGGDMPRSRSTITMISPASPHVDAAPNKAERLLGPGFGGPPEAKSPDVARGTVYKPMGKATSWIKKSFGKQKKTKGLLGDDSSSQGAASPSMDASPRFDISPRIDNSPTAGGSPPPAAAKEPRPSAEQPHVQEAVMPITAAAEAMQSPVSSHSSEGESAKSANSFEGESQFLRAYHKKMTLLSISTTSPDKSAAFFAFEFELPTQSPRSDSFDPAPTPPSLGSGSAPPSPRQPPSPHMSRSFSKRSSLLPPPTASVLDSILASPAYEASPGGMLVEAVEEESGYDAKLHAYAIRMLAELEDAQREYDEWWSDGGIGRLDNAPPRLTVAWPFSDDEE